MVVTTGLIEKIDGLHALNETKQGRGRKSLSSLEFGNFLLVFSPFLLILTLSFSILFHIPVCVFFSCFPDIFCCARL
jgi:hypothetical protein